MAAKKQARKASGKAAAKRSKATAAPALKAISTKQSKLQVMQTIAEQTSIPTKHVKQVFVALNQLLHRHMIKRGSGEFSIPEVSIKVVRRTKPATKKRMGRNPMTGESIMIPAKPKQEVIKVRALKALKSVLAA